jgi:hypothetical protein
MLRRASRGPGDGARSYSKEAVAMFDGVSRRSGRRGGRRRFAWAFGLLAAVLSWPAAGARAQEGPYFVTYGRTMEEPGNLEIALAPVLGEQRGGGNFLAAALELEYGVKAWWTTELYVDGQTTAGDSAVLTGFRWEHRVRPLLLEHWLNPVLYVEFEDITEADKTLLEVVGHDVAADHAVPNRIAQGVSQREMETKLILSSSLGDWDLSENLIAEKDLAGPPWEFGYAVGLSRPLAPAARPGACSYCPENFIAGIEMYGGLGDAHGVGLRDTSHYLAPVLAWDLPGGPALRISPAFGLNAASHRFLLRGGISYELSGFGLRHRRWARGGDAE